MRVTLEEICDPEAARDRDKPPFELAEIVAKEAPPPAALENLLKLRRLGILNGDGILALVAQAPIDPINLMGTLMRLMPGGWAFSAIDFSMVRVLARSKQSVDAAMHVDLLSGDSIKFLARSAKGTLVLYKEHKVTPGPDTWSIVQELMGETVAAAQREKVGSSR